MAKRKSGLTYEQHQALGGRLNHMEQNLLAIFKWVVRAYPVSAGLEKPAWAAQNAVRLFQARMETLMDGERNWTQFPSPYLKSESVSFILPDEASITDGRKKFGFSMEQHRQVGTWLRTMQNELTHIAVEVGNSYPKSEGISSAVRKIQKNVDALRNKLDSLMFQQHGKEEGFDYRGIYFGGNHQNRE